MAKINLINSKTIYSVLQKCLHLQLKSLAILKTLWMGETLSMVGVNVPSVDDQTITGAIE